MTKLFRINSEQLTKSIKDLSQRIQKNTRLTRINYIFHSWISEPTKDDNKLAEKVCKGTCSDLKRNCGQMLGCGDDKFDVSKHCPETCATSTGDFHDSKSKCYNSSQPKP